MKLAIHYCRLEGNVNPFYGNSIICNIEKTSKEFFRLVYIVFEENNLLQSHVTNSYIVGKYDNITK